ncbi:MAG: hypothetical protein EA343_08445 [Nodularia sp. (in: Bacteria)]|nr:MAG: hypothetical protein EA343_08445 [Nodularia sp. (in: cyanobacteria)]
MNKFVIGVLTLSAIAFVSTPANAGRKHVGNQSSNVDNAQIINQTNVTTGDHNTSVNSARQNNQNVRSNARGNSASGQVIDQGCDTFGYGNRCVNQAEQSNQQINQGHQRPSRNTGKFNNRSSGNKRH